MTSATSPPPGFSTPACRYAHFVPATDRLAADAMGRVLSLGEDPAPAPPSRDVPQAPKAGEDGSGIEAPDTLLDK